MDFKISHPDLLFSYVILLLESEGKRLGASRVRPRFARLESFEKEYLLLLTNKPSS